MKLLCRLIVKILTFLKELINYYRETGETDKLMDELEHYLRLVPTDTEMQDLYDQYEDYK